MTNENIQTTNTFWKTNFKICWSEVFFFFWSEVDRRIFFLCFNILWINELNENVLLDLYSIFICHAGNFLCSLIIVKTWEQNRIELRRYEANFFSRNNGVLKLSFWSKNCFLCAFSGLNGSWNNKVTVKNLIS